MQDASNNTAAAPTDIGWPVFTTAERESFFDTIARHRRAAKRVDAVALGCATVLAIVVAMLMAPLLYAAIGLLLDIVNLVVPMPDVIGDATRVVTAIIDQPEALTLSRGAWLAALAALPGLAIMALLWRTLARVMREAMDSRISGTRAPDRAVLAEQRFANVVAEMAIAAQLPAPRVLVSDCGARNAAAFGRDAAQASIVVTSGLLAQADRGQLQGVAAHLVGAIANGDMAIGARVATILGMFGLISRLGTALSDRRSARRLGRLLLRALRPGSSPDDAALALALTNPFDAGSDPGSDADPGPPPASKADHVADGSHRRVPWRTLLWMPLAGPLAMAGFFGGLLCNIVLSPLVSLAWRRRKYMADATAVRLTRDPDALGRALESLRGAPLDDAMGAWIAHLSVVPGGNAGAASLLGGSGLSTAPSLDRRLEALGVLGAQVSPRAARTLPTWAWCVLAPVVAALVALVATVVFGLLYLSTALSGLFTWTPAILLHAVLR